MKRLKILRGILHMTKADKILFTYVIFVLLDAMFIWLVDPAITTYGDSIWYCCATISTAGFGDVVATTALARGATILLMIYSILVLAIVTGVVVNFYNQLIDIKQNETVAAFVHKLEHLPELSKEELQELSDKVAKFRSE